VFERGEAPLKNLFPLLGLALKGRASPSKEKGLLYNRSEASL